MGFRNEANAIRSEEAASTAGRLTVGVLIALSRRERSTPRAAFLSEEYFSRNGAKAQSATAFLRVFFAPLRLCARKYFRKEVSRADFRATIKTRARADHFPIKS